MFQRFTHTSRRVMIFANSEAHRLRCGIIGDAEFLLGLIAEDSGAGLRLLRLLGVDVTVLSAKLEQIPRESAVSRPPPKLPQTTEAKVIIQGAIDVARETGTDRVGTLHIVVALLRHPEFLTTKLVQQAGGAIDGAERLLGEAGVET